MNLFIYALISETDEISLTLQFNAVVQAKYDIVKVNFDYCFDATKNANHKQSQFIRGLQKPNELVDDLSTAFHSLEEWK